jgi:glyoxylase-like metal-dependent hydrolase (beta-lactamase superfamily II)
VCELGRVLERHPDVPVLAHALEEVEGRTATLDPGQALRAGELEIEAIHTPGHTAGMLALVVNGSEVFTGDTLFKNSVGGVRAPGSTSYADLRESIMERLMGLDHGMRVHPGHTDPTTIGQEWESNRFIRVWRGLDPEGDEPCTALGEPATLILLGDDYDGGHKAWVRWPDGRDDIVPGSQVQRGSG